MAGNLKEDGQIELDSAKISLFLQIWLCLAKSSQHLLGFLQTSDPGIQVDPAIFCLPLSGTILTDSLGLGVARHY